VSIRIKSHSKLWRKGSVGVSRDCPKLVRDALLIWGLYCAPWSFSCPRVSGAWLRSHGSFEYQFLIDNTVYRYFKFALSAMSIILQCRHFVSVLARDARYCKARFCNRMSSVHVCVRPSVTFVDQDHIGCKSLKLIARTITPTPSLFVAQRPSTYFQGNVGKVCGDCR